MSVEKNQIKQELKYLFKGADKTALLKLVAKFLTTTAKDKIDGNITSLYVNTNDWDEIRVEVVVVKEDRLKLLTVDVKEEVEDGQ